MEIVLPKTFSDLTIGQYTALHSTQDEIARILILNPNLTQDKLNKLPKKSLDTASSYIRNIMMSEEAQHIDRIDIDGELYGFVNDWDSFSFGEYIDMQQYCRDVHKNATKIMSIMYRKVTKEIGDKYWIESYTAKEDDEKFSKLPATLFGGVLSFFLTTRKELLKSTKQSLIQVMKAQSSEKNGVGILQSTHLQTKSSSGWTRLLKNLWVRFSRSSATYKT